MVDRLAKYLNVAPQRIATIGDQMNDVLMFKRSGLSIAMDTTSPEVQRQANFVTTSNRRSSTRRSRTARRATGARCSFFGLGTGLGSALVVREHIVPMELGHLAIGGRTFEQELGVRGLKRAGRKKWEKKVDAATERFVSALLLDDVVLGGGNAKKLTRLPQGCRMGDNANAFIGGFRLWQDAKTRFLEAAK